jgi:hypothetical protein
LVRELLMTCAMRLANVCIVVVLAACNSEQGSTSTSLTREPGECSDVEVHVIGVYDGGSDATVDIQRPGKQILVLAAHQPTTWNVNVHAGATLQKVYAVGYYPQKVLANVRTQIMTESKVEGGAGANGYMYPDKNTDALLKLTSIRVDLHATSFHGCYEATKWTIGENMLVTSDCAAGAFTQFDAVTDCDGDNQCGSGDSGSDGSLY